MSVKDDFLAYLASYGKDEPNGLTQTKYAQRARDEYEEDGRLYFKMERHHSALGSTYMAGLSMVAVASRVEKYQYDSASHRVSVVESGDEDLDLDSIDYVRLAEELCFGFIFEFRENDDEGYILSESSTGDSWIVLGQEDFSRCANEISLSLDAHVKDILSRENIKPDDMKKLD